MSERVVTAGLIVIGNEILSGRTQDKNIAYLGSWLGQAGIRMTEVRVIPDIQQTIVDTVNEMRQRYDYVFTTGGIGPTHDDITSESVAAAFGLPHAEHPEARAIRRVIFGGATEVQLDSTGRILIPPFLREYAKLDGESTIVGAGEYFEIWNAETWSAELVGVTDPDINARRFSQFDLSAG